MSVAEHPAFPTPQKPSRPETGPIPTLKPNRDLGIDALRGVAIVAMVAAHLARPALEEAPLWLRVWSSVAAPLFVILAGMLVAQTQARKGRPLSHYLTRAGVILLLAAWVDAALWGLYPFMTIDVLYLIGVALPITALFARLSQTMQNWVLLGVLVVGQILRNTLGYPEELSAVFLWEPWSEVAGQGRTILEQWLFSGWFPLFPWLFFSFLGVRLYHMRSEAGPHFAQRARRFGLALACVGVLYGLRVPAPYFLRDGYIELFYPPTTAFVLVASGVVLIAFSFVEALWLKRNRPLILLGQCPLLMYVLHLAIIQWGLKPLFTDVSMAEYVVLYGSLLALLVGVAELVDALKRSEYRLPFVVRMLVGS